MFKKLLCWLFLLHLFIVIVNSSGYIVPLPTFEISPVKGFKASIPDTPGIALYAFHGRLNKEFIGNEAGDFNGDITTSTNGQWTYENKNIKLENNDILHFWIYVQHENLGYRLDEQTYRISVNRDDDQQQTQSTVTTVITPTVATTPTKKPDDGCQPSITEVFGVKQCQGALIFEEEFNTFDDSKWQYAIELDSDDYKFATYQNYTEVCQVENGNFIITPKLFVTLPGKNEESLRGGLDFGSMCTGTNVAEQCIRPASFGSILPPVVSCKIRTRDKFRFKYGKIEIRANLPIGDWIFPELFLDPSSSPSRYYYGQLRVGFIRSNEYLTINGTTISGNRLYGGAVLRPNAAFREDHYKNKKMENHFGNDYHVYGLTWTDEKISMEVDGELYGEIDNDFQEYITTNNIANNWRGSSTPFNREFFLSLGVGVGGISDFPDRCLSRNKIKPWVNSDPRNVHRFWNAHDNWYASWTNDAGDNIAQLKVDYVKVETYIIAERFKLDPKAIYWGF